MAQRNSDADICPVTQRTGADLSSAEWQRQAFVMLQQTLGKMDQRLGKLEDQVGPIYSAVRVAKWVLPPGAAMAILAYVLQAAGIQQLPAQSPADPAKSHQSVE